MSNDLVPVVPLYQGDDPSPEKNFSARDTIAKRISKLRRFDELGARAIIADTVQAGLSDFVVETLIKPLADALGVSVPAARKLWKDAASEARDAADVEAAKATADERERIWREIDERHQRETQEEHERLWSSCKEIAESPTLLADMEKIAHRLGLVGEGASVRAAYLTASSRLNKESAICLLRRGAPAGGKNFLVDKTFALIPAASVVRMSSGSPLSLVYFGGEDEDALKHKIVYVPEAAVIADRNRVESPLTIMLRVLISEGRLDHHVALPQADGPPQTVHIKRNGPVVVLITSARDNVEDELLTRLMTSDADESPAQTLAVLSEALPVEDRDLSEAEIERWLDFQRWLMIEAPYEVVVPFRWAILKAFTERREEMERRGEKPKIQLRLRRDVHGMLTAIKSSAILHKAQREKDASGRIIATIDDYRHAYEAFDEGLARLYKVKTSETALAVVKAIEEMGASIESGVKVSVSALMLKLGITGRGATADRIKDAEDRGFIKLVEKSGGYGRTTPHGYMIVKPSQEIEVDIKAGVGSGVFPPTESVETFFADVAGAPRYSGTTGIDDYKNSTDGTDDGQNCTACTTVPKDANPSDENILTNSDSISAEPEEPEKQKNRRPRHGPPASDDPATASRPSDGDLSAGLPDAPDLD